MSGRSLDDEVLFWCHSLCNYSTMLCLLRRALFYDAGDRKGEARACVSFQSAPDSKLRGKLFARSRENVLHSGELICAQPSPHLTSPICAGSTETAGTCDFPTPV